MTGRCRSRCRSFLGTGAPLVCTHFGCVVRWVESEGTYKCPCHEGRFDANGEVLGGPPTRRLFLVPVSVSGKTVTLGT
jgi:Rieske Fe-S protein